MQRFFKISTLVSLGVYLLPLALLALMLALNTGSVEGGLEFKDLKWTLLFWMACAGLCTFCALVVGAALLTNNPKSDLWLPLVASSIIVVVLLGIAEAAIRFVTIDGLLGQQIGPVALRPYDWETTRRNNKKLVSNSQKAKAYYVAHPLFGWAIGASRTSADGLYASSIEGLRSATVEDELAGVASDKRIALYGDSFIFSEEVGYTDSLAFHLENSLGPRHQVLNFGVPGYGIDQAHLRFVHSSAAWRPKIAVLGFISHDLERALDVYTFLRPSWGIPFSKPRFEISGDSGLRLNNVPNIAAAEVFSAKSISELPLIQLDPNYFAFDWHRQFAHNSMIFRLVASLQPRYPVDDGSFQHSVTEIGAQIMKEFISHARSEGIIPLVVYLPSRSDFRGASMPVKELTIARARELGVEVVDLTECLITKVPYENLFVSKGVHYSGQGNHAFSQCLISLLPDFNTAKR